MTIDRTKLAYSSEDPIDKIVSTGTITVVNDGATSPTYQKAKIVTSTITNPYGKKCFVRARWSVDGTNKNSLHTHLVYTFVVSTVPGDPGHPASATLNGLKAAVSIGVSNSTIYFRTANGLHGNVSGTTTPSYTPTSQTFTIDYALYEIE